MSHDKGNDDCIDWEGRRLGICKVTEDERCPWGIGSLGEIRVGDDTCWQVKESNVTRS